MTYYLAIDIGASSGRHILGWLENGQLRTEEVYRFANGIIKQGDSLLWDAETLVREVITGIKACGEAGKIPKSIAIDTWGVDYVLLDEQLRELPPVYAYRDARTAAMPARVEQLISPQDLYVRTGIARQAFNSIYQLMCDKESGRLAQAAHCLMMPDYLAWRLTGLLTNEYTNATTTGLVNAATRDWDTELLQLLGLPAHIFQPLGRCSDVIGTFTQEIQGKTGFDAQVIFAPTHDTASAVAACDIDESSTDAGSADAGSIYISSGTWSLIGIESPVPILSEAAWLANFTNEGGAGGTYRVLKNLMGMWLLQGVRRDIGGSKTPDDLMHMAMESGFVELFDVNSPLLTAPENMTNAVCALLGRQLPVGDVLNAIYHSLAQAYAQAAEEIEAITGRTFGGIHIVGGGGRDAYLGQLTAQYTGKQVTIGRKEATAAGNLLSQVMADTGMTLAQARNMMGGII